MNARQRMQLMREIAIQSDLFAPDAERLGKAAALALRADKRAQISGLEAAANSALSVADVLNYIKVRTARAASRREWRWEPQGALAQQLQGYMTAPGRSPCFGNALLGFIEGALKSKHREALRVAMGLDRNSPEEQQAYLQLIRRFVRQMAVNYEYEANK